MDKMINPLEQDDNIIAFKGEVMLAGWAKSTSKAEPKATFFFSSDEDLAPLEMATIAKGKQAGQRYMMVLVEIGNDELPIPKPEQPKGGPLSKSAAMLCQDADFQSYVQKRLRDEGTVWPAELSAETICVNALYRWCKMETRATLDHDADARMRFFEVTHDFERWRDSER